MHVSTVSLGVSFSLCCLRCESVVTAYWVSELLSLNATNPHPECQTVSGGTPFLHSPRSGVFGIPSSRSRDVDHAQAEKNIGRCQRRF